MPIQPGGTFTPDNAGFLSPGVFSREIDSTGIAQGIANIGAAIVSPFPQGPAFSPMILTSQTQLNAVFGIDDGTFYGPYTAGQYLTQKGFVTVCRVGALTGYHQMYPFVIYAQSGNWQRNPDLGNTLTPLSYITILNSSSVSMSLMGSNVINASSGGYTASLLVTNVPVVVTFAPEASSTTTAAGTSSLSGSTLYYGQEIEIENISFTVAFTGSLNFNPASLTSSAFVSNYLFTNNVVSGSFSSYAFQGGGTYPFTSVDSLQIISGAILPYSGACATYTYAFIGMISGSFGTYNGTFVPNTSTYNPCSASWTNNSAYKVIAVLADTQYGGINTSLQAPGFLGSIMSQSTAMNGSSNVVIDFGLTLQQTNAPSPYGSYNFSLNPSSTKYITNVFGTNPQVGNPVNYVPGTKIEASYLYCFFEDDLNNALANPNAWAFYGAAMPSGSNFTGELLNFTDNYSLTPSIGDSAFAITNAYSPWVISQQISEWGNASISIQYPLFQIQSLGDGTNTNTSYKIEISNVRLAGTVAGTDWGTFTLQVRQFSDTDQKPIILETFSNLTLDPTDPNYIALRIGDKYNFINFNGKILEYGMYDNQSNYIRIVMSPNAYPEVSVPYGFQAYATPINSSLGYWCNPLNYSMASVYGLFPGKYPSGLVFNDAPPGADNELLSLYPTSSVGIGVSNDTLQYMNPLPSFGAYSSVGRNAVFALDIGITNGGIGTGSFLSGSNAIPSIYNPDFEPTYVKMRNFVFGLQGGFDGQSPAIEINLGTTIIAGNTQGLNCATSTTAGSVAYAQCINTLGNADQFDINLIATPGIIYSLHSYVTNLVVTMCESRGDCFYIMDIYADGGNPTSGQINNVVELASQFDTSYAATYYPWLKIKNTNTNQIEIVPPSVVLPGIYAANDVVAAEWYAIAGLNRGGIPDAVGVTDKTTNPERDTLYQGKVNPIASFPGQNISVWGQKTLQNANTAENRINVRRLLIELKKFISATSKFLLFEQNTSATWNKFLAIVNPYLENVQQRSGLYAFQVLMNSSTNSSDLIDQNILYGKIMIQPARSIEFIVLDFILSPTGAAFPTS